MLTIGFSQKENHRQLRPRVNSYLLPMWNIETHPIPPSWCQTHNMRVLMNIMQPTRWVEVGKTTPLAARAQRTHMSFNDESNLIFDSPRNCNARLRNKWGLHAKFMCSSWKSVARKTEIPRVTAIGGSHVSQMTLIWVINKLAGLLIKHLRSVQTD